MEHTAVQPGEIHSLATNGNLPSVIKNLAETECLIKVKADGVPDEFVPPSIVCTEIYTSTDDVRDLLATPDWTNAAVEQMTDISVTPWAIRKALNVSGLRASVEAAVKSGSQDLKDAWEFAQEFKRLDPLVIALGQGLGVSDEELDNLFKLAATL